jgi:DnaK suppressor protein
MPGKKNTLKRKAVKKTIKKVVKKSAKKPVKKTVKKVAKKPVKKTVKKVAKKPVKKTVKKVAKKPVKKTAKKAVKKPVKKTVKKVAKKPVKKLTNKKGAGKKVNQLVKEKSDLVKKPPKRKNAVKVPAEKSQVVSKKNVRVKVKPVEIDYTEFQDTINASTVAGPLDFSPYTESVMEEYMSDDQVEHFHNILLKWKEKLMSEVDTTVVHLKTDAEAYADPLDRAAQEEGFNLELRTRDRERKLIKKIEEALDWINEGVYGYCEDCGAEIGVRRLEARPTAAKCIDCKTYSEIREKQMGND